jgi:hypothetical protein
MVTLLGSHILDFGLSPKAWEDIFDPSFLPFYLTSLSYLISAGKVRLPKKIGMKVPEHDI